MRIQFKQLSQRMQNYRTAGSYFPTHGSTRWCFAGHTEAGCDLTRLAGFEQSFVKSSMKMAQWHVVQIFCWEAWFKNWYNCRPNSLTNEQTVERLDQKTIQTEYLNFTVIVRLVILTFIWLRRAKRRCYNSTCSWFQSNLLKLNKADGEPAWNLDRGQLQRVIAVF